MISDKRDVAREYFSSDSPKINTSFDIEELELEFENSISNKWVVIENIDIDEDGYIDDYYDDWIYHDITDKYVDCIEKYEHFCETKREEDDWTEYLYEEIIID